MESSDSGGRWDGANELVYSISCRCKILNSVDRIPVTGGQLPGPGPSRRILFWGNLYLRIPLISISKLVQIGSCRRTRRGQISPDITLTTPCAQYILWWCAVGCDTCHPRVTVRDPFSKSLAVTRDSYLKNLELINDMLQSRQRCATKYITARWVR